MRDSVDGGVRFSSVGAQLGIAVVALVLLGRGAMFLALGALVADFGMAAFEAAGFSWKFFPGPPIARWFVILLVFVLVLPLVNDAVRHLGRALEMSRTQLWEQQQAQEQIVYQAQLIAQAADPVVAADNNHVVTFWNAAAARLFGWTEKEALGRSLDDVLRVPSIISQQSMREQLAHFGGWKGELPLLTRSGEPIIVDAAVTRLRNAAGEPVGSVAGFRDITERKRAEEQLRYQATLLAGVNDAIVASDAQYRLTAWNAAAESLYGWKAEQVLGRNGLEILRTEWLGVDADEMRRTTAELGEWRGEVTQVRKDGTRIPVEVSSMVLRDESGQIRGYVSVNRDITERKRAEEQIEILSRLPAENPNPILRIGPEDVIRYANKATEPLLAMWNTEIGQVMPDELRMRIAEAFKSGQRKEIEVKCGPQVFSCTLAPVLSAGYINVYGSDITDRKRAQEALEQAAKRFELVTLATQDALYDWDLVSHEIWRNENYQRLFGAPEKSLDSDDWWLDRLHPEDRERVLAAQEAAFGSEGNLFSPEYRLRRPDGSYADIVERSLIVRDARGQVVRMIGALTDISERKRAEEALRQSEQFNREVIASAREGVIVYDREFRYQVWNRFMEELSGVPASQVLGKQGFDLFPHLREQKVGALLQRALEGEVVHSPDMPFVCP